MVDKKVDEKKILRQGIKFFEDLAGKAKLMDFKFAHLKFLRKKRKLEKKLGKLNGV